MVNLVDARKPEPSATLVVLHRVCAHQHLKGRRGLRCFTFYLLSQVTTDLKPNVTEITSSCKDAGVCDTKFSPLPAKFPTYICIRRFFRMKHDFCFLDAEKDQRQCDPNGDFGRILKFRVKVGVAKVVMMVHASNSGSTAFCVEVV